MHRNSNVELKEKFRGVTYHSWDYDIFVQKEKSRQLDYFAHMIVYERSIDRKINPEWNRRNT